MIAKADLIDALYYDCAPYEITRKLPFPKENDYAYLDESGDGDPSWTFNRDRMEEDAYTLLKDMDAMSYDEFMEREREVLFKIEEILNNTASRCTDKKIIGDIGFWTGGAYRLCADFLRDIKYHMFKDRKKGTNA